MRKRRRLLAGLFLVALTAAGQASAAEVGIAPGLFDSSTFRLRVDRIDFVDPITPPLTRQRVVGDAILPGNVASFRLSLSMTLDPAVRIYDFTCAPNYAAQSVVFVQAAAMPMSWQSYSWSGQVMSGALVWEEGACSLVRSGVWEPGKGMRWSR